MTYLFPKFSQVVKQLAHPTRTHFESGSLLSNAGISLLRVVIGFVVAATVGIALGALVGSIRILRYCIEPVIELLRPLCPVAWLPFALAVFKLKTIPQLIGISHAGNALDQVQLGMVFVIFVGGFFPIFTNTFDGIQSVRQNYLRLGRMLGASPRQLVFNVYLPAALPSILTGLRQGLGLCWFVIIAAEMMTGSDSGIGYLLMYAADNLAMDIVIASMVIIGVIGALLNTGMRLFVSRFTQWKGKEV